MIVKIIPRGSGGGAGPIDYLLGKEFDREGASVLRGNPIITRELINATDYARRYTSICLSFEEAPTDISNDIKNKIMTNFEKTIFPGLEPDQYNVLWVEHTDKGRLELNFLVPNQELRSGKRLQPFYHVADLKRVDAFQNVMNLAFGLTDPHDPTRKRAHSPYISPKMNLSGIGAENLTDAHRCIMGNTERKRSLTEHIYNLAAQARFKTTAGSRQSGRDLIMAEIRRQGYTVERVTKKSISVSYSESKKNIRLNDKIFSEDFDQRDFTGVTLSNNKKREEQEYQRAVQDGSLLKENLAILQEGIMIKESYHKERFSDSKAPEPLFGIELRENASLALETTKEGSQDVPGPRFV